MGGPQLVYGSGVKACILMAASLVVACSPGPANTPGPVAPLPAGRPPGPVALNPDEGLSVGSRYEAFLSPQQEPGEERDTPSLVPDAFRSTAPSLLRNERTSRGHGVLRFTRDLSRVFVDLKFLNVKPEDVVMFHIHCGKPDMLGPILVDLGHGRNFATSMANGTFSVTVTNEDIEATLAGSHGVVGAFTVGCPINLGLPGQVKTIAGMHTIAEKGELYFNLHTRGQTFYGDIRGQIFRVSAPESAPAAPPSALTPPAPPAPPAPAPRGPLGMAAEAAKHRPRSSQRPGAEA